MTHFDIGEVFDDFLLWTPVKRGDEVTVLVNGKEMLATTRLTNDGAIGLLKQRTNAKLDDFGKNHPFRLRSPL